MPTGRRGNEGKPTQVGPRGEDIEAQEALANDVANSADYQTDLSSARDTNAALGDSTGNARESAEASGLEVDENAIADTQRAFTQNRGNRQPRDPKQRF